MTFKPGQSGNPAGRKKGSVGITSSKAAEMVLKTLDDLGGEGWLKTLAKKDARTFCSLIGRLLPKEMKLDVEGSVAVGFTKALSDLEEAAKEQSADSK